MIKKKRKNDADINTRIQFRVVNSILGHFVVAVNDLCENEHFVHA